MEDDKINPVHYKQYGELEPIKVIKAWGLCFNLGNALKYIARAGKKKNNTELQDLKKALWYINDKINDLENEHN